MGHQLLLIQSTEWRNRSLKRMNKKLLLGILCIAVVGIMATAAFSDTWLSKYKNIYVKTGSSQGICLFDDCNAFFPAPEEIQMVQQGGSYEFAVYVLNTGTSVHHIPANRRQHRRRPNTLPHHRQRHRLRHALRNDRKQHPTASTNRITTIRTTREKHRSPNQWIPTEPKQNDQVGHNCYMQLSRPHQPTSLRLEDSVRGRLRSSLNQPIRNAHTTSFFSFLAANEQV
jgi:hypothetical protein